jgi:hypothetical protein
MTSIPTRTISNNKNKAKATMLKQTQKKMMTSLAAT